MPGKNNLPLPGEPNFHELTREERVAGQKASALAKKRKQSLKELIEKIESGSPRPENKKRLIEAGLDPEEATKAAMIAYHIVTGASNNDHKSIEEYLNVTGQKIVRNVNENYNVEMKPLIDLSELDPEEGETKDGDNQSN